MSNINNYKFIHLLYVPTMNCNMKCKYCYLDDNTVDLTHDDMYLNTLVYTINKLKEENIIPFNISLHGGEVTTLAKEDFKSVIKYIYDYYNDNKELLEENGFKVGRPHIKTNLFNLEKHIETIKEYEVSISGSLDLPFPLHDEYRLTKGGEPTLKRILKNVELLETLPNKKKVSSTIFKEHYDKTDMIIEDIKYLNENTCLDMNDFNFMIGFITNDQDILHEMSENEQVDFYSRMKEEFLDSSLDEGVRNAWFAEFNPTYCTNCDNCGEKFFLLERDGDIYSCVRGQRNENFYYGNIYKDSVLDIINRAQRKIFESHNKEGFSGDCIECKYLYLCKTGCPYVKNIHKTSKSYTCLLQQEIYKDNTELYPVDEYNEETVYDYLNKNHPLIASKHYPKNNINMDNNMPTLQEIISSDDRLKNIFSSSVFILDVDGNEFMLESQILKTTKDIIYITDESILKLYIKKGILEDCSYPVNNSLYMMLLSGDTVQYGDENRVKQEHIMTHQIYTSTIIKYKSDKEGYYLVDITELIRLYLNDVSKEFENNLFFTTSELRDYHYNKHKNNAYYHIQTINLPFQNIEFMYVDCKEEM